MNLVFGPKFNKEFPRKYLESKTCGDGFWESTGKDNYQHTGVDIEADIGSQVMPDSQKKNLIIPHKCIVFTHGVWLGWWADGNENKSCPGCISVTLRCRKIKVGGDIGWQV